MQRAYLGKLMEIAEKDPQVLHLVADSGTGFDEMFQHNFPKQMLNFGIAEEHMVAAAAGLATGKKIPFVYTAGAFLAYRALEFIRDDVCFQNLNVKVVGMGSGLSWSSLGPSHHTTEDIAVLRAIPNLTILSPATPYQVAACVQKAYDDFGPVYIRIGMNGEQEFFNDDYKIPLNGMDAVKKGNKAILFTTGSILSEAIEAASLLDAEGIDTAVINVVQIKPFMSKSAIEMMKNAKYVITVEEHNIYGGLGGILAEVMAEHGIGKRLLRIGLNDVFATGYSNNQESMRKQNHLDAESIRQIVMEAYQSYE